MRQRTVVSAAVAGSALVLAAGAAAVPRVWRRLRRRGGPEAVVEDPFAGPYGDPEAAWDPAANAAVREELKERVADVQREPEAPVAEPVEPDLIVEGVPGSDPGLDAARARLRERAERAREGFRG